MRLIPRVQDLGLAYVKTRAKMISYPYGSPKEPTQVIPHHPPGRQEQRPPLPLHPPVGYIPPPACFAIR